ncbi:unnamed protein product [Moneuplotes crassus]|uniref:Uncharacterized protein n=1 Tax=Euplotes crassus TaxID=5936 RepID=A0AAD1Y8P3_EUPCR|nr:unnamed protein product [Moneuplotes crassus]
MDKRIPTLKKAYNFAAAESGKGTWHRNVILMAAGLALAWTIDKSTGFSTLGCNRTPVRNQYKFRPDYLTGSLFMAQRKGVPEYKHF